jgi:hypothetical protein
MVIAIATLNILLGYLNEYLDGVTKYTDLSSMVKKEIIPGILYGFITGIVVAVTKTLSDVLRNLHNEHEKIRECVDETIRSSLPDTFGKKEIYITGVHHGKPAGSALIVDSNLVESEHSDGLLIMKTGASPEDYARHCTNVLDNAVINGSRPKIYSMSDLGLDRTFELFCDAKKAHNTDVRNWIIKINCMAKKDEIQAKRIQVLTKQRHMFMQKILQYINDESSDNLTQLLEYVRPSIKEKKEYENESEKLATNLVSGFNWYCENYALVDYGSALLAFEKNDGDLIQHMCNTDNNMICPQKGDRVDGDNKSKYPDGTQLGWALFTQGSAKPSGARQAMKDVVPGEFIIFDEKALVRYSEDSRLSETLVGEKIVDPFSMAFSVDSWELELDMRPLFFGIGEYNDSERSGIYTS